MKTFLRKLIVSVTVLLLVGLTATSVFLSNELINRYEFMGIFIEGSAQLIEYEHTGVEAAGMYNIVLRADEAFTVLVGFELTVFGRTGFDYYGAVPSGADGVVVISTYLGRDATTFQFLISQSIDEIDLTVSSSDVDQALQPDAVYPPHWWQRLGFYS